MDRCCPRRRDRLVVVPAGRLVADHDGGRGANATTNRTCNGTRRGRHNNQIDYDDDDDAMGGGRETTAGPDGWIVVVPVVAVGTLKDGYLRKVPLPRAPLRQSSELAAVTTDSQIPDRQIANLVPAYSQVPRVPTWSDLTRSLVGDLGARTLRASWLM